MENFLCFQNYYSFKLKAFRFPHINRIACWIRRIHNTFVAHSSSSCLMRIALKTHHTHTYRDIKLILFFLSQQKFMHCQQQTLFQSEYICESIRVLCIVLTLLCTVGTGKLVVRFIMKFSQQTKILFFHNHKSFTIVKVGLQNFTIQDYFILYLRSELRDDL